METGSVGADDTEAGGKDGSSTAEDGGETTGLVPDSITVKEGPRVMDGQSPHGEEGLVEVLD